jgi:squalene-associated FAD-dependent desaturase
VLWEPLCLAALNTPLSQASAEIFITVLHEAFAGERSAADLLYPRADLGSIFPEPAIRFIREHGGTVRFRERVVSLAIRDGRIDGVTSRRGIIRSDHVIIAASPGECLRLTAPHPLLTGIARQLAMLRYEPICTIYLQYPAGVRLGGEMVGMLDGMGQWIHDLGDTGHPGRMAVVISGPGSHMTLDNDALIARIRAEVTRLFPRWPTPSHALVIREKRATFSCHSGVKALRPAARTAVPGLWLAGDYTDTGLPATLEGAVRSGVNSAQQIRSIAGIPI